MVGSPGAGLSSRPQPDHVPGNPDGYDGDGRWVDAIDLRVGDVLLLRSGEQAAITGLVVRHARLPVYNFQVEELHCYAVGHAQILVHNNSVEELLKPGGRLIGTEGTSSLNPPVTRWKNRCRRLLPESREGG